MKICAIIVTRNRLAHLKHCLAAVRAQRRPVDEIIVINNDSTDGSKVWIETQKDIISIHQENTGGAGGFHTGISRGLARNNDWLWCMDDDGYPDQMSLKILLSQCNPKVAALNSVTISTENPRRLSFGMPRLSKHGYPKLLPPIRNLRKLQKSIDSNGQVAFGSFFNGTLLNAAMVRKTGNVNADLFIWGDEQDLAWRLLRVAPIYTILSSIHYHPEPSGPLSPWKFYYRIRNGIYINNTHLNHRFLRNSWIFLRGIHYLLSCPAALPLFKRALADGFAARLGATISPTS